MDGLIMLGRTMSTDLALDFTQALPMGVPEYVVSTVSFFPILPNQNLNLDIQLILWAGGLYGLHLICKSSLSQAAGAVLGAAMAVEKLVTTRPVTAMTSMGSSCPKYMKLLCDPLRAR